MTLCHKKAQGEKLVFGYLRTEIPTGGRKSKIFFQVPYSFSSNKNKFRSLTDILKTYFP